MGAGAAPERGSPCEGVEMPVAIPGSAASTCMQYDSPRDAFLQAIAGDPLVLAIGEVHAPKGASVPSAAKRFTDEFLPLLAGRASDLLLELMRPPTGCADAAAEVRRIEEPITSRHAEAAQDEYVAMGERARGLGIVPDMLRPTCADMDAIRLAARGKGEKEDAFVDVSLKMIARLSRAQGTRLIDRDENSDADRGKMVVLYGGALHNVLVPALVPPLPSHEPSLADGAPWSYAPELSAHVHGRLVALDLVVPEFVNDDDTWRSFSWWPLYESARRGPKFGQKTTLLTVGGQGSETRSETRSETSGTILVFPVAFPR
jgi:hypothetical protein